MAPEQFAGKGSSVQSDIYALGLVLYVMYMGRSAFEDSFSAALDDAFGQLTRDITSPASRQKLLQAVRSAGTGTQ